MWVAEGGTCIILYQERYQIEAVLWSRSCAGVHVVEAELARDDPWHDMLLLDAVQLHLGPRDSLELSMSIWTWLISLGIG